MVKSEPAFQSFATEVRKNVESALRDYEIEDAATKRGLLGALAALDLLGRAWARLRACARDGRMTVEPADA